MSDKALNAWMKNEVKLGAKAGLTAIVLGANTEAAATTNAEVDVIAWAKSKGAYAGLTIEGTLIRPRAASNEAPLAWKSRGSWFMTTPSADSTQALPLHRVVGYR